MINSLKDKKGRGAIVVPTGFITAKSGIKKKILQKIVDEKIIYGCVSMPSNVFATTGTNVSVLFFDKSKKHDKVILIDASKLGEEYKDGNNKRTRLRDNEINKIVDTFLSGEPVENFCACPSYNEVKEKGYSLSAGQYFEVRIEYQDITEEEFNSRVEEFKKSITQMFNEGKVLEKKILDNLNAMKL